MNRMDYEQSTFNLLLFFHSTSTAPTATPPHQQDVIKLNNCNFLHFWSNTFRHAISIHPIPSHPIPGKQQTSHRSPADGRVDLIWPRLELFLHRNNHSQLNHSAAISTLLHILIPFSPPLNSNEARRNKSSAHTVIANFFFFFFYSVTHSDGYTI